MQTYLTIKESCVFEFVERKSRFIGSLYPVCTPEEAHNVISSVKKEFWDASHNCSAYIIGEHMELMKFSDDGEPQGTAGVPMLEALKQSGFTNILAMATRYFGGVLLGAGGLVRAYTRCVSGAIETAKEKKAAVRMIAGFEYHLMIPYTGYGKIEKMIDVGLCNRNHVEFGEQVSLILHVPVDADQYFLKEISEAFLGSISPEKKRNIFIEYPINGGLFNGN